MASLTNNFLLEPLLRQPFLSAEREDSHDKLVASVAVGPSELDVSPFGLIVVLGLVKSKGHRSFFGSILRGVLALATNAPRPAIPHSDHHPTREGGAPCRALSRGQCLSVPSFCVSWPTSRFASCGYPSTQSVSLTAAQDLSCYMIEPKERPSRRLRDAYHRRYRSRSRLGCFGWLLSLARSYWRTGIVAAIPATTLCVSATLKLCTGAICTCAISSKPIICTSATLKPTI